jgi:hypothetical protein
MVLQILSKEHFNQQWGELSSLPCCQWGHKAKFLFIVFNLSQVVSRCATPSLPILAQGIQGSISLVHL